MAVPINSFDDFMEKFDALKHQRTLFGFLLFDDRPSQKAVERFADEGFGWLDGLAASAQMFFFIFLRRNEMLAGEVENPGLEVSQMFGIRPNKLPGIVLFTMLSDRDTVSDGVYLPIDGRLFEEDVNQIEEIFADLFSMIQEAQETADNADELFKVLGRRVAALRRNRGLRPIKGYLRGGLEILIKLPENFVNGLGSGMGQAIVRSGG